MGGGGEECRASVKKGGGMRGMEGGREGEERASKMGGESYLPPPYHFSRESALGTIGVFEVFPWARQ